MQSQRNVGDLHLLHDWFGGSITLLAEPTKAAQRQFRWKLAGAPSLRFCQLIKDKLLIKRREVAVVVDDFPFGRLQTLRARNSDSAFTVIVWRREACRDRLQFLKIVPHDVIPETETRPIEYWSGVKEGDGSLGIGLYELADGTITGRVRHSITQKHKPLLEAAQREFGGSLHYSVTEDCWTLSLHGDDARNFESRTRPHAMAKIDQHEVIQQFSEGKISALQAFQQLRMYHGGQARLT